VADIPQPQSDYAPIWHFVIMAVVGGTTGALLSLGLQWWLR
jgi:hypothetical protein